MTKLTPGKLRSDIKELLLSIGEDAVRMGEAVMLSEILSLKRNIGRSRAKLVKKQKQLEEYGG